MSPDSTPRYRNPLAAAAPVLLLTFVNAVGGTLLIPVLPFVVRDLGYSDVVFSLLIAAYPAAQFFAAPILGGMADHYGRRPILLVSQAGTLASWVLFGVAYAFDGGLALTLIAVSRIVDGLTGGNASVAAAYLADVIEPEDNLIAIGSGGPFAQAAARALLDNTELDARDIVEKGLGIAGDICIYTNHNRTIEELTF